MDYEFRWNQWNFDHIAEHGVTPAEAEFVVNRAGRPWPRKIGNRKYLARGPTSAGRLLQVIYVLDPEPTVFVIHARDLTDREKRQLHRRHP